MNCKELKNGVIEEVKKMEYLDHVVALCQEDGFMEVQVKYLGGKEVLLVLQNSETVENIMKTDEVPGPNI